MTDRLLQITHGNCAVSNAGTFTRKINEYHFFFGSDRRMDKMRNMYDTFAIFGNEVEFI